MCTNGPEPHHSAFTEQPSWRAAANRTLQLEQALVDQNRRTATAIRTRLEQAGIFAVQLLGSPGAGKTALLVRLIEALRGRLPVAVIEGDQAGSLDARRIEAAGAPCVQINTGRGCHLDARMISEALLHLAPSDGTLLFIENLGNLICPALFDLGEARRVAVLSVTEGEDKPRKYPQLFATADLVVLHKSDLLPHLDVDVRALVAAVRHSGAGGRPLFASSKSGQGIGALCGWILEERDRQGGRQAPG
jgi:hydrogenase nickel incorporation protein HypB